MRFYLKSTFFIFLLLINLITLTGSRSVLSLTKSKLNGFNNDMSGIDLDQKICSP